MLMRDFSLGVVLTVAKDRLLVRIDEVYDLLNHMVQDTIFTHQIPRAMDVCRPWLVQWHPFTSKVDTKMLDKFLAEYGDEDGVQAYLDWLVTKAPTVCPRVLSVGQIDAQYLLPIDPVEELLEMRRSPNRLRRGRYRRGGYSLQ